MAPKRIARRNRRCGIRFVGSNAAGNGAPFAKNIAHRAIATAVKKYAMALPPSDTFGVTVL